MHYVTVALFALPLVTSTALYTCARRRSVGKAWSTALAMLCAASCCISNSVALSVVASAGVWHTF